LGFDQEAGLEPNRLTDPQLAEVLDELRRREPIFHRPELGSTRAEFAAQMADGFWEVGASGQRYSRDYVLDVLEERQRHPVEDEWTTSDFHCQALAEEVFLLTYTLHQGERVTRRSTIWRRVGDAWRIVFHQGTLVQAASPP
jgi:hypothetical protein